MAAGRQSGWSCIAKVQTGICCDAAITSTVRRFLKMVKVIAASSSFKCVWYQNRSMPAFCRTNSLLYQSYVSLLVQCPTTRSRCAATVQTVAYISRECSKLRELFQRSNFFMFFVRLFQNSTVNFPFAVCSSQCQARPTAVESLQHSWLKAQEAEDPGSQIGTWSSARCFRMFCACQAARRHVCLCHCQAFMLGSDLCRLWEALQRCVDLARPITLPASFLPQGHGFPGSLGFPFKFISPVNAT